MKIFKIFNQIIKRSFDLSSLLMIILVFLTTEQVVARYAFGASSIALQELTWYVFGIILMLSMAQNLKDDNHVRVDFLSSQLSKSTNLWRERIGLILFIVSCSILIFYGISFATEALSFQNLRADDFYTSKIFSKNNLGYEASKTIEVFLRQTILAGEVSSNPEGLPGRWLIKALFPLGMLILLFQSLATFIGTFKNGT